MGSKYTEAQKNASLNYQKTKSQLKITIPKENLARYQEHARTKGVTMTELIVNLIENDMRTSQP